MENHQQCTFTRVFCTSIFIFAEKNGMRSRSTCAITLRRLGAPLLPAPSSTAGGTTKHLARIPNEKAHSIYALLGLSSILPRCHSLHPPPCPFAMLPEWPGQTTMLTLQKPVRCGTSSKRKPAKPFLPRRLPGKPRWRSGGSKRSQGRRNRRNRRIRRNCTVE